MQLTFPSTESAEIDKVELWCITTLGTCRRTRRVHPLEVLGHTLTGCVVCCYDMSSVAT